MKVVSREEYEVLVEGAEVWEDDRFGPKILATRDGRAVKFFRVKRWLSWNLVMPYARRFARNAELLAERGVRSVKVELVGRVPHLDRQVVVYRLLPGSSVRSLPVEGGCELMERFGRFLAELHERGVYFRSLHLGNVVCDGEGGEFGLIDVLDLKVGRWPVSGRRRRGNFLRLVRYEVDRRRMAAHWVAFRRGYEGWVGEHAPGRLAGLPGLFADAERKLGKG
jgi:hypothetical protein